MALTKTQNDLPERTRQAAIELLGQQLADALDLHLQAKQAHWNVKGPNFIALHDLPDEVEEEMEEHADDIAERAVALGGMAFDTARTTAGWSRLTAHLQGEGIVAVLPRHQLATEPIAGCNVVVLDSRVFEKRQP